jgi:hypothetical protein
VAHCDSDDFVEPTMYAKLYENAIQNDSDMVICGRITHCADGREVSKFARMNPKESFILNYLHGGLGHSVWNRLTRTDIYRRVQFPKDNYFEDGFQTAQLLTYARRISFLNEPLYHYVLRPASISTARKRETSELKIQQCITNYNLVHDFIMEHHPVTEDVFFLFKVNLRSQFIPHIAWWSIRKKYLQMFPETNFSMLFNRNVRLAFRVPHLLILLGLFPIIYPVYTFVSKKVLRKILKKNHSHSGEKEKTVSCCS